MEEVPYRTDKEYHYLPHHCVTKGSTTTKLRVVYNASQRTANGKSLNDQLAIGRIEQWDILSLLVQFRFFKYAFVADVEKMYKQSQTSDVFTFDIPIPVDSIPRTKRQLTSEIASLFDPLG